MAGIGNLSPEPNGSIFVQMNEPRKQTEPSPSQTLDEAISGTPSLYANGFSIGVTNADVVLVLARANRPVQTVHMSYTLAKTLHLKLSDVIEEFEGATGRVMLTTDDVDEMIKKKRDQK